MAGSPIPDDVPIIWAQPPSRCELCKAVAETRPYGPSGEEVCFECGMKDEPAAERAFREEIGMPERHDPDTPGGPREDEGFE